MKKLFTALAITSLLISCNSNPGKGKFTVNGELKDAADQHIYLEELFFNKGPEVLDTGMIKNGRFTVSAIAPEEGLYRLRMEKSMNSYLFINEGGTMNFYADMNKPGFAEQSFSGSANGSLKKLLLYIDSVGKIISAKDRDINDLVQAGTPENDSTLQELKKQFSLQNENFINYCFTYADTAKSPVVSLFIATMAPVTITKLEAPIVNLSKRFPEHKRIADFVRYIKSKVPEQTQLQPEPQLPATIGSPAPDITMNDINDKPFSLSRLRGKYVLVDFWASWCGPCRDENPNVVAAYNQFKDKNFTVLGVSLDKDKASWLKAIKEDNLTWDHISDLKYWNSAAVGLYGFDGIPYNVLVDPQGKIIATGLRESALQKKLSEVLK